MMFPLPIRIPKGERAIVTQPFGPTANSLEPKGPNGEPHFHYGIDIVLGDDHATYGATLCCPFPMANIVNRSPQPVGSHITPILQLQYVDTQKRRFDIILAHCSEMEQAIGVMYGSPVAKIGNIGLVSPQPSLKDPYAGAHLHLGLMVNGVYVDPERYFDLLQWFQGDGPTQQDQLPATNWLITELLAIVQSFTHG